MASEFVESLQAAGPVAFDDGADVQDFSAAFKPGTAGLGTELKFNKALPRGARVYAVATEGGKPKALYVFTLRSTKGGETFSWKGTGGVDAKELKILAVRTDPGSVKGMDPKSRGWREVIAV